jgi:ketosteroid isomerase-like protein
MNEHEGVAAMAHPNEDVIRRMFEAYRRGDEATLRQVLAEDVVYHLPGRSPMAGAYRGRDEVLALWDRQKAYLGGQPYRVEPLGSVADDQHVVLLARGEAETNSQTLTWRAANIYQVRDGQVVECRVFIQDLYAFDEFWSGMPSRRAPRLEEVGDTETPTGVARHPATDPRAVAERWVQALTAHDLEAAVACFAPDYHDEAPARRGEFIQGNERVRENLAALFRDIPDLRADLLRSVEDGDTVWIEWRMCGTRRDGTAFEFAGVNLFGVRDEQFVWGRIYTELVRDAGGIDAQIEHMTKD